jgi:hypothetical protein
VVKASQSARSKLVKVLLALGGGESSKKEMEIGRWSEFKRVFVHQETEGTRWVEMSDTSGEEEEPLMGSRVEESKLREQRSLLSMASAKETPLASLHGLYQLPWCALKSPKMIVSSTA